MDNFKTQYGLESVLQKELSHDEHILWEGKPKGGIQLNKLDIFLIPFSILWGCGAIFGGLIFIISDTHLIFRIFGILFALLGLYFIGGRFFIDLKQRESSYYALTNKRINSHCWIIQSKNKVNVS